MHADKRRRKIDRSRAGAMVILLLITAGCALPAVERESLEYARMDAQNRAADRYESLKRQCRAAGGVVLVQGDWGRTNPKAGDMKTARCGSRIDSVIW